MAPGASRPALEADWLLPHVFPEPATVAALEINHRTCTNVKKHVKQIMMRATSLGALRAASLRGVRLAGVVRGASDTGGLGGSAPQRHRCRRARRYRRWRCCTGVGNSPRWCACSLRSGWRSSSELAFAPPLHHVANVVARVAH